MRGFFQQSFSLSTFSLKYLSLSFLFPVPLPLLLLLFGAILRERGAILRNYQSLSLMLRRITRTTFTAQGRGTARNNPGTQNPLLLCLQPRGHAF